MSLTDAIISKPPCDNEPPIGSSCDTPAYQIICNWDELAALLPQENDAIFPACDPANADAAPFFVRYTRDEETGEIIYVNIATGDTITTADFVPCPDVKYVEIQYCDPTTGDYLGTWLVCYKVGGSATGIFIAANGETSDAIPDGAVRCGDQPNVAKVIDYCLGDLTYCVVIYDDGTSTIIDANDVGNIQILDELPDGAEPCEPFKPAECVKWSSHVVFIDNTFTRFTEQTTFTVTMSDGSVIAPFTDAAAGTYGGWTQQLQGWQTVFAAQFPNAVVEARCNIAGGCGGLLPPPSDAQPSKSIIARYLSLIFCPTDPIPVRVQFTNASTTKPRDLVMESISTPEKRGQVCRECGEAGELQDLDGNPIPAEDLPACYFECTETIPQPVEPTIQCEFQVVPMCDFTNGLEDCSSRVEFIREVWRCFENGELFDEFAIDYNVAGYGDPDTQTEYVVSDAANVGTCQHGTNLVTESQCYECVPPVAVPTKPVIVKDVKQVKAAQIKLASQVKTLAVRRETAISERSALKLDIDGLDVEIQRLVKEPDEVLRKTAEVMTVERNGLQARYDALGKEVKETEKALATAKTKEAVAEPSGETCPCVAGDKLQVVIAYPCGEPENITSTTFYINGVEVEAFEIDGNWQEVECEPCGDDEALDLTLISVECMQAVGGGELAESSFVDDNEGWNTAVNGQAITDANPAPAGSFGATQFVDTGYAVTMKGDTGGAPSTWPTYSGTVENPAAQGGAVASTSGFDGTGSIANPNAWEIEFNPPVGAASANFLDLESDAAFTQGYYQLWDANENLLGTFPIAYAGGADGGGESHYVGFTRPTNDVAKWTITVGATAAMPTANNNRLAFGELRFAEIQPLIYTVETWGEAGGGSRVCYVYDSNKELVDVNPDTLEPCPTADDCTIVECPDPCETVAVYINGRPPTEGWAWAGIVDEPTNLNDFESQLEAAGYTVTTFGEQHYACPIPSGSPTVNGQAVTVSVIPNPDPNFVAEPTCAKQVVVKNHPLEGVLKTCDCGTTETFTQQGEWSIAGSGDFIKVSFLPTETAIADSILACLESGTQPIVTLTAENGDSVTFQPSSGMVDDNQINMPATIVDSDPQAGVYQSATVQCGGADGGQCLPVSDCKTHALLEQIAANNCEDPCQPSIVYDTVCNDTEQTIGEGDEAVTIPAGFPIIRRTETAFVKLNCNCVEGSTAVRLFDFNNPLVEFSADEVAFVGACDPQTTSRLERCDANGNPVTVVNIEVGTPDGAVAVQVFYDQNGQPVVPALPLSVCDPQTEREKLCVYAANGQKLATIYQYTPLDTLGKPATELIFYTTLTGETYELPEGATIDCCVEVCEVNEGNEYCYDVSGFEFTCPTSTIVVDGETIDLCGENSGNGNIPSEGDLCAVGGVRSMQGGSAANRCRSAYPTPTADAVGAANELQTLGSVGATAPSLDQYTNVHIAVRGTFPITGTAPSIDFSATWNVGSGIAVGAYDCSTNQDLPLIGGTPNSYDSVGGAGCQVESTRGLNDSWGGSNNGINHTATFDTSGVSDLQNVVFYTIVMGSPTEWLSDIQVNGLNPSPQSCQIDSVETLVDALSQTTGTEWTVEDGQICTIITDTLGALTCGETSVEPTVTPAVVYKPCAQCACDNDVSDLLAQITALLTAVVGEGDECPCDSEVTACVTFNAFDNAVPGMWSAGETSTWVVNGTNVVQDALSTYVAPNISTGYQQIIDYINSSTNFAMSVATESTTEGVKPIFQLDYAGAGDETLTIVNGASGDTYTITVDGSGNLTTTAITSDNDDMTGFNGSEVVFNVC